MAPYACVAPIATSDIKRTVGPRKPKMLLGTRAPQSPFPLPLAIQDDTSARLPVSLVATYSFNETEDTLARDVSGSANDAKRSTFARCLHR